MYSGAMLANKRTEAALQARLDEVAYRGFAYIHRFELYAWYARQRLTQNVFHHVLDTYAEIAGGRANLKVLKEDGGYLLVDGGRLESPVRAFELED